jgi:cytochrome c556
MLESSANDRDITAEKLRDWSDGGDRTPAETEVLNKLWSEMKEFRAAAQVFRNNSD